MTPRVGVVVVDYDGGELTLGCLRSLARTEWPEGHLDVVLVDNASPAPVTDRVRAELPAVRIVESSRNLGFAGGVDLGLDALRDVDHVALVNNDATVPPGWLTPLVRALEDDPRLGAVCPKILFADRFVELELHSRTTRRSRGDRRDVGVRVSGVEVDGVDVTGRSQFVAGFWGPEHGDDAEPAFQWTSEKATLRVPVVAGSDRARIRLAADISTRLTIASDGRRAEHDVGDSPAWYDAPLGGEPFDVVHNVGNEMVADGYGADRGYLARDRGQLDEPEDVFAWCGAAVLLAGAYLDDVGYLDRRLFMYYEDFEHAWRGRVRGWRYRTEPSSVVRHMHSATSVEGSSLFGYYNERNHLLVLVRHAGIGLIVRAFARYVLITASYARRDVISRWLRRERTRTVEVRRRMRALLGALRLTPAMVSSRLGDRRRGPRRLSSTRDISGG